MCVLYAVRVGERELDRDRDFFALREINYNRRRAVEGVSEKQDFKIRGLDILIKPGLADRDGRKSFNVY